MDISRRRRRWFALAARTAGGLLIVSLAAAEQAPRRQAFFGDLHMHTGYSFDAFVALSSRTTPDDAYRFAKGEPIRHQDGSTIRLRGPRLDFLAVTDHAEFLGVAAGLLAPSSPNFEHPDKQQVLAALSVSGRAMFNKLEELRQDGSSLTALDVLSDAWQRSVDAARRHNSPGEFTAFVGYEFTGELRHRNVIFKDGDRAPLPFSALDSELPQDLWRWLDEQREGGVDALAIPHMSSMTIESGWHDTDRGRLTTAQAEQRRRLEPLLEIYQQKGSAATHPLLSPNDEWAEFSIRRPYDDTAVRTGTYWRTLLARGMAFEAWSGINPYRQGAAGGSDSHFGGGQYDERDVIFGRSPQRRGSVYSPEPGGWEGFVTPVRASGGSGGLTGIWAEENTRAALFEAMRRRETFATSGPRITLRLFGGFALADHLVDASDDAPAYLHGVPMGGMLNGSDRRGQEAPTFLAWALRDPQSGRLQRLQIVKGELASEGAGWLYAIAHAVPGRFARVREYRLTGGAETREQVFDVACSENRQPNPRTHRCPDNGVAVDLEDCSPSSDLGAESLRVVWTDPDFHPRRRSYYYLRVLENPSCRWSTWDAIRHGVRPNPDLPATIEERAWSSPIWYAP